jgi:hypothetical protein
VVGVHAGSESRAEMRLPSRGAADASPSISRLEMPFWEPIFRAQKGSL